MTVERLGTDATNKVCFECKAAISLGNFKLNDSSIVTLCARCAKITLKGEIFFSNRNKLLVQEPEFALIANNVWAMNTYHGPGNMNVPTMWVSNRTLILRLRDNKTLLLVNPNRPEKNGKEPFAAIKRLERRIQGEMKYVITLDSGHNLYLKAYSVAFPNAVIYYPKGRIDMDDPSKLTVANLVSYLQDDENMKHLEEMGAKVMLIDGQKERKMDLNKRKNRCAIQAGVLVFNEHVLISGAHTFWTYGYKDPYVGFLFRKVIFPRSKELSVLFLVGVKGSSISPPIYDIKAFKGSIQRLMDAKYSYYMDFHSPNNSCVPRAEFEKAFKKAYEQMFTDETKVNIEILED